jgi:hypothetical protein
MTSPTSGEITTSAQPPATPDEAASHIDSVPRGLLATAADAAARIMDELAATSQTTLLRQLVVLVLYVGAARLMIRDPWFSGEMFLWRQSSILVILGLLVVLTMAFEWHLLGVAKRLNLLAQLVLAYPFTIFLARLLGRPWNEGGSDSLLARVFGLARTAAETFGLTSFIPAWLADAFASPGTTLVLLAFCLVTVVCQSPAARIGGTVTLMLVPLAVACAQPPFPSRWFLVGLACMVAGMWLQYADVTKYYRDRTILDRLRHVTDEAARRASLRLVTRAWDSGRLGEATAEGIVRQVYAGMPRDASSSPRAAETRDITRLLVHDLVTTHGLLDVRHNTEGIFLVPAADAAGHDEVLEQVARFPRIVLVTILAIVWVLMPVDLLPDAIPLVGAIDDVVIMSLASWPLGQLLGQQLPLRRSAGVRLR